ncbi:MAG TPA: N-acetyltransferase [Kiloniellaceae bacterium]|nr:N-acetyltransferase [Kiloniellaceae bacterium]HIP77394.1 N-acetyltransferase [Kiloniellaceae bacterium]
MAATSGTVRPATAADRPRIEAIVTAAYSPYIERMGMRPGPMLDDYAKRIADKQAYVLEAEGRIAGILVLEPGDGSLLLDNIAIDPACQGSGHGRRLMTFAENTARQRGCACVVLYTHELMTENIALYRRYGYVELERRTVSGFDRVYMEKRV